MKLAFPLSMRPKENPPRTINFIVVNSKLIKKSKYTSLRFSKPMCHINKNEREKQQPFENSVNYHFMDPFA